METEISLAVEQTLFVKLSAFHEASGKTLNAVWHVYEQGCLDQVILDFGSVSLIVNAVPKDDSIDFQCIKTDNFRAIDRTDASLTKFWKEAIGLPFGWGWVTVNQQGYCDGLLISFDGIEPQVSMNVMASSIKLKRFAPASQV